MKKHYLLSALAVAFMASCQNEDGMLDNLSHASKVEVTASLEETPDSRTALQADGNGGYKVIWSEDDAFSVFYGSADAHNKFVLTTGDGQTSATFESEGSFKIGSDTENGSGSFAIVGYYPYSSATTVSQSNGSYVFNTEIPVNQTYAEGSFGQSASPMVAVSDNLKFSFKNVASALRVPLLGDKTITKATLTSASKIAGAATVTVSETDGVWLPSVEVSNGSSMVVLSCGNGVELNTTTATDFIFVLAPGTYAAGMVVKFYASDGSYYSYTTQGQQTFTRSQVTYLNDKTYGTTGTGHETGTAGVEEANNELANGVEDVTVTIAATDSEPTVELPATTSENPINLTFTSIPGNTTVTIEASTESNNGEAKEVNVSVPSNENGYNFNINLPNSTVTLGANGETATYNEVTAATASNTLIVGKGVTVQSLKVKQGNARVKNGAQITSVERTSDNGETQTYIIYEGAIPSGVTSTDNLIHISAAEYDLKEAVKAGGTVNLSSNVTLTSTLEVNNTVVLNLGGYTLTNQVTNTSTDVIVVGESGNLTINGEGNVTAVSGNDGYPVISAGTLTINGGTFTTGSDADGAANACIYARGSGKVYIAGGEFKGPEGDVYILNKKDADRATTTIEVTGGKFYAGFDPANNAAEGAGTNFVKSGYTSTKSGDYYEVAPSTVE